MFSKDKDSQLLKKNVSSHLYLVKAVDGRALRLGEGAVVGRAAGLLQPPAVGRLDSDVSRRNAHHVLLVVGLAGLFVRRSCRRNLKDEMTDCATFGANGAFKFMATEH